jgi:hypothetical protein
MDIKTDEEAEMSLINDYSYQVMTDERERDIARLVKHNHHVRAALDGRVSWLRRLQAHREERISIAAKHSPRRGMATPQHRVAH